LNYRPKLLSFDNKNKNCFFYFVLCSLNRNFAPQKGGCMKEMDLLIHVLVKQEGELNDEEVKLLDEARRATYRSYAPYSHFSVGAAVELADGTIVSGSNQENAAYPSGLCAERTAVFYANSRYPDQPIRRICIVARDAEGKFLQRPISPCGACRQVLLEAERRAKNAIEVLLYGTDGVYVVSSIKDLLPLEFELENS
jgi:cytidine deaminase